MSSRYEAKPGLRFDRVATRVVQRVRMATRDVVPDGTMVLLAISAPIRLASKTAAAVEEKIRTVLVKRPPRGDATATVHGNRVQIRIVKHGARGAPKLIGFVHNSDSNPARLFAITADLLERMAADRRRRSTPAGRRRSLAVASAMGRSWLPAYRYIGSQLELASDFDEVVVVFADGRVDRLAG